jgi:hypothetical protein
VGLGAPLQISGDRVRIEEPSMNINERIALLRAVEVEIKRRRDMARIERATSWVNGTGGEKAAEYTQAAQELEALHTAGVRQWSALVAARIQAALKAGCFVLGMAIAAGC